MTTLPENAALILIDIQMGMDDPKWGTRNNPNAEDNMATLLAAWRSAGKPIFHVQHMSRNPQSPLRPDQPGNAIKPAVRPQNGEPHLTKNVNSAFIGTDLETRLRDQAIDTVVLVGLVTDHCVSTTARMAANLGFKTFVVSDATATFGRTGPDGRQFSAQDVYDIELASLHREFAQVVDTGTVLAELGA